MSTQTYIPRDEYLAATPAVTPGAGVEMSRLEQALKDFNDYYERITDVGFGARIGRSGDNQLMLAYGQERQRAEDMKQRIESVLGAWDTVKGWVGLGALPLIPIAVAIGLTAAIIAAVRAGRSFMRSADIKVAMLADPELTFEQAAAAVDAANRGSFEKAIDLAQWGVGAFVVWMIFRYLRE